MTNQKSKELFYFKIPVFVSDLIIHIGVLAILMNVMDHSAIADIADSDHWPITIYALLTLSFCVSIGYIGLRLHERRIKLTVVIYRAIIQTLLTYILFVALVAMVFKDAARSLVVMQVLITMPLITLCHYLANKIVRLLRHWGHNVRSVVIVGVDETTVQLYKELLFGHAFTGYKVEGFFTSEPHCELPEGATILGRLHDLWEWLEKKNIDEIYCSLPPATCSKEVNRLIQYCNDNFTEFFFVPTFDGYPKRQLAIRSLGKVNYMKLREEPMNSVQAKLIKRAFDILVSGLFLCTLFPFVVLFVWVGNKVTGNVGRLYFRQARTGYNGKSFRIYKFRSMKENAEADKLQATENDPRKTPFGDFLRRSSIDELPQFINVFIGDMSIIGPRPHMEYHTEVYSELIGNYMVRHLARPGITGWAQISGCRGETKTVQEMADRVEHDIWYIEHWTPLLDIEIFFRTFWQVLPGHDKQAY